MIPYTITKRIIDILSALLLLFLLSPLFLLLIILLFCTAERQVFFKQERIGLNNRLFMIWKFATMLKDSPNMGSGTITLRHDPRVTPLGRVLRRTKLNELPQLFNVLKGDMSFVGPRPLDDKGFLSIPEAIRNQVYLVRPGITGAGSVVFRDEERMISESDMEPREFYRQHIAPYKAALEIWYQGQQSLWTDVLLVWLTVWTVLFPGNRLIYKVFSKMPV